MALVAFEPRTFGVRLLHKPGIYGSGRVWACAWDVFHGVPSRVGRGRLAAVDFVVRFGWGRSFSGFFLYIFFS